VFLLSLFEQGGAESKMGFYHYNIEDPYGKSPDEFHKCFRRIERCLEGLFSEIGKKGN
jgi:protein-tyrosine-phosphatase